VPLLEVVETDRLDDRPAASWDALVSQQTVPSPFLRSWWLAAMPAAQRLFLEMYDGGRLVGGIPLVRDRLLGVPRYRFLGQGVLCPDHLDLMAAPGFEDQVADAFATWFAEQGTRLLDASGLVSESLLARALGVSSEPIDLAPYQVLPATREAYLASRSKNFRRSLRRTAHRLDEVGMAHRRAETREEIDAALEVFGALHSGRPGRQQLLDELPTLRAAVQAGAERGEMQVDVLDVGGETVAVSLFFCIDDRLSCYQHARSLERAHDGAGTALIHRILESGIKAQVAEVDLLRGDERYKSSFADGVRELHRVRVGHGATARLLAGGWRAASHARSVIGARRDAPPART
jgi:CelD/BcsL family acetyltransferase involved in cellulose biosynthesis